MTQYHHVQKKRETKKNPQKIKVTSSAGTKHLTHYWFDTWKDDSTPKDAGNNTNMAALVSLQQAVEAAEQASIVT